MQTDVLIIGQGISGTMLSWFLHKAGKSFIILDDNKPDAPSKVAAGVINPVTGRKFVYSWMIDTIMPFAVQTYTEMGHFLDQELIRQKDIIDVFPSAQMRDAFVTRLTENDTYLHTYPDQNHFNQFFHFEHGCGKISPAYIVNLQALMASWRHFLQQSQFLKEEVFNERHLTVEANAIYYRDIKAEKIIFCDGLNSMQYRWFEALPFSPSKGEALVIESDTLTNEHIFKRGMMLVPLYQKNRFWVGSSFQWKQEDALPTEAFLRNTKTFLDGWLKVSYKVVDHLAALRPATLERRPFVGFHPGQPAVGILNGMGTKGTSLSPFFAYQLVQNLLYGFPITEAANVQRFTKILSRE